MEFWLLAKVGLVIKALVSSGYAVAGSYMIRTGMKYVEDYKTSIENEKEVR